MNISEPDAHFESFGSQELPYHCLSRILNFVWNHIFLDANNTIVGKLQYILGRNFAFSTNCIHPNAFMAYELVSKDALGSCIHLAECKNFGSPNELAASHYHHQQGRHRNQLKQNY